MRIRIPVFFHIERKALAQHEGLAELLFQTFAFHFLPFRFIFIIQIIETVRGQLKSLETVGQILDFLGFTIKMLFVPKSLTTTDLLLLNEIFQVMPSSWESDPVKVSVRYSIRYSCTCEQRLACLA